jgi:hypothetical protein
LIAKRDLPPPRLIDLIAELNTLKTSAHQIQSTRSKRRKPKHSGPKTTSRGAQSSRTQTSSTTVEVER